MIDCKKLQVRNFYLEQTERLLTSDVFKKKKNKVGRKQIKHFMWSKWNYFSRIINLLLTKLARDRPWENIDPWSFLYRPCCAWSKLSRPRADILPVRPSCLVNKIYVSPAVDILRLESQRPKRNQNLIFNPLKVQHAPLSFSHILKFSVGVKDLFPHHSHLYRDSFLCKWASSSPDICKSIVIFWNILDKCSTNLHMNVQEHYWCPCVYHSFSPQALSCNDLDFGLSVYKMSKEMWCKYRDSLKK